VSIPFLAIVDVCLLCLNGTFLDAGVVLKHCDTQGAERKWSVLCFLADGGDGAEET
jgi:hypothetical protein